MNSCPLVPFTRLPQRAPACRSQPKVKSTIIVAGCGLMVVPTWRHRHRQTVTATTCPSAFSLFYVCPIIIIVGVLWACLLLPIPPTTRTTQPQPPFLFAPTSSFTYVCFALVLRVLIFLACGLALRILWFIVCFSLSAPFPLPHPLSPIPF